MPSLLHLPNEVHLHILSHLHHDCRALALTCRTFHRLCDLPTRKKFRRVRVQPGKNLDRAFDLLLAILRRPSLGRYVRHIEYQGAVEAHVPYEEQLGEREAELQQETGMMGLLWAAVRRAIGVDESNADEHRAKLAAQVMNMLMQSSEQRAKGKWNYTYRGMHGIFAVQAVAALLVSVAPDLESMALVQPFFNYTGFYHTEGRFANQNRVAFPLDYILRRANGEGDATPFLRRLRHVYFINAGRGWMDDERFYTSMDFLGMFALVDRLPAIEIVGTDALCTDENGKPGLEPNSSNISRVRINHSAVDTMYLASVISACKSLRELQFSLGGRASSDGSSSMQNPKTFLQTLLLHRETLEVLDVDFEANISEFWNDDDEDTEPDFDTYGGRSEAHHSWTGAPPDELWDQKGSLRNFTSLTHVSLGLKTLLYMARGVDSARSSDFKLADHLPPNLEYLLIRGYERGLRKDHDEHIDGLLSLKESEGSKLREIRGIDELIPHAEDVDEPDDESAALWEWEEEEWSEDE
ncbi:uncharacterized protein BO95DRAFT_350015 [Aspergillus brunneoviolaceus CBS 621.78]|uniref:Uncharacterized protein n=1 Tax=Aspergillus brunneoviolaceus CBS 621.78 TaxID=1450534 RepID=A0ACD1GQC5_9EURO|nr:hypothetical protein BO95DRAFT_350015 [Aspergillus brunneoviolaceus CBS 621.78]RAH51422.1 hypothetical protein BO95DRAFT_350015 [Aspergillus brunneoviolaceus CBS 621.78]